MRSSPRNAGGFSLSEVTISIGIVAALMLPLLAMLADSGETVVDSRDRFAASQLIRAIEGRVRYSEEKNAFLLDLGAPGEDVDRLQVGLSDSGVDHRIILGFDHKGEFVREVSSTSYRDGLTNDEARVFYLASIELSRKGDGHSTRVGSPKLFRCDISVEAPAFAAEADRKRESISTLLSAR